MKKLADTRQVGGNGHYTAMAIQPFHLTTSLGLGGIEHTIIKYVSRWREKGGIEDLRKAFHTNEFLVDVLLGHIAPQVTAEDYCEANQLGELESQVVRLVCACAQHRDVRIAQEARLVLERLITLERPR